MDSMSAEERSEFAHKGGMARFRHTSEEDRKRFAALGVKARMRNRKKLDEQA